MPQPLKKLPDDLNFTHDAVTLRPSLGVRIAQISAIWAKIETHLGLLLAIMLNTNAKTGISMYLSLTGSAAQEHVLSAAAEAVLSDELKAEFTDLLTKIRKRGKERNRVVHCMWGIASDYPESLINCPPDNLIRDVVDGFVFYQATGFEPPPNEEFISNLMAYNEKDFKEISNRLAKTLDLMRDFGLMVGKFQVERNALVLALKNPPVDQSTPTLPDKPQTNPEESS